MENTSFWSWTIRAAVLGLLPLLLLVAPLTGCACVFPGEDCDPAAPTVTNETTGSIILFWATADDEHCADCRGG